MEEDEWDDALLSEIDALEKRHLETTSHKNQPQIPSTTGDTANNASSHNEPWNCRSCTLRNEAARTTCQVCNTQRGQTYKEQMQTSPQRTTATAKKTIQARLTFNGSSQRQQDVGRSEPSPFSAIRDGGQSQTMLSHATGGSRLVLTSRRSGQASTAPPANLPASSPIQIPRHAAGEDIQAQKRYLDVETHPNLPQIDYEAAQHFVYPTNYSIRDYQLTIAEKALYHNTMVSLPTGLGKTLVAAVVMYNFYRWFPTGKIVFMAPTKPLVAQQIKACHEIMGIPLSDTAELQGNVAPTMRRVLWKSRRVFFCTPQSLQNDLRRGICAAEKFVCVVADEAHRATGNYAYCCVVQEIEAKTRFFRILALSATPGAKFDVIQDVVTNLRISHIESRSADDPDVKKYTHARQEEVIVCRLGEQIMEIKAQFLKCLTPVVQRLLRANIIQYTDPEKISSWYVLQSREKFRKSPNYASNRSAESDLALLVSLLHAKSLLTGHGLSSFRDQITSWIEERKKGKMSWSKREMLLSPEFQALESSLAVTESDSSSTHTASHPKLVKLREVLLEHFQRHAAGESSTRAIVFTQYRASVSEIVALLRPLAPLLSAQPFIGQGTTGKTKSIKGQTQKMQQEIVRRFRLGEFNVLVATCIAEEGLDIGEVDLIVSFDALTSPVRMIQRMGRTGRKRVGRVIILVTEGDEQKKLARSASAAKTVSRALTTFKNRFTYSKCPRMLPTGIYPQLKELEMKIPTFHASQVGGKTASVAVDPDLWQLTDAERAVALMKYFPPNFASSSRNKLFPVVANRMHLLRRQPRSLLARKGVGTRVGYSTRSFILQSLVRKINGLEEVVETDSEDEEALKSADRSTCSAKESDGLAHPGSLEENRLTEPSRVDKIRRRIRTSTDKGETDSEIGPPWRESSPQDVIVGDSKCDDSFSAMTQSVDTFDMHFSPEFIDPATQFTTAIEDEGHPKGGSKRHQDDQIMDPSPKKQKIIRNVERASQAVPQSKTAAVTSDDDTSEKQQQVSVGELVSPDNIDNEEKSQQMSASLSLTLTSDSASEAVCQQEAVKNIATDATVQHPVVSRHRQLHFDDDIVTGGPLDQTDSAEDAHPILTAAGNTAELQHEKNETPEDEDEGSAACSFAPGVCVNSIGGESKEGSEDEDRDEEDISAFSFALLPPLNAGAVVAPSKPAMSSELVVATASSTTSQTVEDGTDGDEVDEVHQDKSTATNEINCRPDADVRVIDLTKKQPRFSATMSGEKVEPVETVSMANDPIAKDKDTCQNAVPSQRKESQPEQEEDGCCSICLETESYDDDPIVFCDGCNVAVHQFCYGIHVVPKDKWFCDVCAEAQTSASTVGTSQLRCQLCPHRGGAYKRTECGKWVHVQCFLWIPEFRVEQGENDQLVLGDLKRLDPDRKTLHCSLCNSQKGNGVIQCAHKRCLAAFHVSCAAFARYRMDQLDPRNDEDQGCGTLFLAYCPLHRNSTAPVTLFNQEKTPPAAKARSPKPPLPSPAARTSSPSHLLASPSSIEAKRKFKTFRRLKRKYDASQAQMFSQSGTKASPVSTSPWQKRIRRSKRRRETARVLAAAYIDDVADVRGGVKDDDDEDDYGDDYKDAADDSFINDSSQLLYSQSVVSPEDTENSNLKKKSRKRSSPNMRAIYARSLFESQSSPLLLRRGGRHLDKLPSNGIIRACLDELHNGPNEVDTPSPRPRSRSRISSSADNASATPPALSASATVTESDGDDEADPSPSFAFLANPLDTVQEEEESNSEMAPPSFNLLGIGAQPANSTETFAVLTSSRPQQRVSSSIRPVVPAKGPVNGAEDGSDELHKKVEANRMKALKKLEERRLAKRLQDQPQNQAPPSSNEHNAGALQVASRFTSAATLISRESHEGEVATPSFSLLGSTGSGGPVTPARSAQQPTSTVDLTSPGSVQQSQSPKWVIFVSSSFANTRTFPAFLSEKHVECTVAIDDSLEADVLLSVRMGVLFVTGHEVAAASPSQNVVKNRRLGILLAMHKKLVIAVVHDGDDPPGAAGLRKLPNATVIVQSSIESLCVQLHKLARQEMVEGYEMPSPSLCRPEFPAEVKGLDKDFAARLEFFRSIAPLSLGSALSLSFRFKNFVAGQVPVLKFNEMHWRRMLPWITDTAAEEIRNHVRQNVRR
ncbi:hypothetical protein DVH05_028413 [Phytophthora capsici]|nr:hypothetical protein DVH05_028413 [Phytophthora capsici]